MDDRTHSRLKRIIGWGSDDEFRMNRLTHAAYQGNHRHFPEHGPDVDDMLAWLTERWDITFDAVTRPGSHRPRSVQAIARTHGGIGIHFQSQWHDTLIEALAETVLFLGAELERT